jgi:acyl carrier protein
MTKTTGMEIEQRIRAYLAENVLFSEDGFAYGDDASFLEEALMDSLGVVDLVAFVERTFGVVVDPHDVTLDNFDSVNKLAGYVRRSRARDNRVG